MPILPRKENHRYSVQDPTQLNTNSGIWDSNIQCYLLNYQVADMLNSFESLIEFENEIKRQIRAESTCCHWCGKNIPVGNEYCDACLPKRQAQIAKTEKKII